MKKFIFLLLFLSLLLFFSCKKDKNYNSNSIFLQSKVYKNSRNTLKIKYLDSLTKYTNTTVNDSVLRNFLFKLSTEYYYLNENKKSLGLCNKILHLSNAAKDTFSIAKTYSYIGDTYELSEKDSAYYYYQKSEKLFRKLNNEERIGLALFKKAYILFYEGNYIESEVQVSNALLYLKKGNDAEMLFTAYSLMGLNFEKLEEYKDALKYQLLAKSVLKDLKGSNSNLEKRFLYSVESSINISNVYEKTFQYDKSVQELESILTPELKEKWLFGYVSTIGNLGYSKMKRGKIIGVDKYFKEALFISRENDFKNIILYQLKNLGEYYSIVHDTMQSVKYLKQSLQLAEKLKVSEEIKSSLKILSKIDHRNTAKYDKRYIVITDSLAKVQRASRNKYARIEYETSVVEDENKLLTAKNTSILVGSLLLIFSLVLLIVYRYFKSQKREILFRITQQNAEQEIFELLKEYQIKLTDSKKLEQNRISKELHDSVLNQLYGARMQLGILNNSDEKEIKEKRLLYVDLLQDVEQEIRTISHDLYSDVIDAKFDYVSLLSNLMQLQNEIGITFFSVEVSEMIDWNSIDGLVKITIFRIVQEAILNVTKHSNAKLCKVSIKIEEEKKSLLLIIQDDGVGFDVLTKSLGIGLKNIKDRVTALNSQFTISSSLESGTIIQITFFKVL